MIHQKLLSNTLERILGISAKRRKYRQQILRRVVIELNIVIESRTQTRIAVNEASHWCCVAGHNDHHFRPKVFHCFQQGIDHLFAKVMFSLPLCQ